MCNLLPCFNTVHSETTTSILNHLTHILKLYLTLHCRSSSISSSGLCRNHFTACSVLDIEEGLTVYGAEGMDGCLGPTAAWRWGTGSLSVWDTLLLLCPTHWTIDLRLPHVHCANTAQVYTDSSSTLWTQYLTTSHMQTFICLAVLSKHEFWAYNYHNIFQDFVNYKYYDGYRNHTSISGHYY